MPFTQPLIEEYRNGILECVHMGIYAIINEKGVIESKGDPDWYCFYRSASKPIQALPAFMLDLPRKYGLNADETAILSGSHRGEDRHIAALEGILQKCGLSEADMIMSPTYPLHGPSREKALQTGRPPRKLFHNCAGKHLCLMLTTRELGGDVKDYWRPESPAQREILRVLSRMTDVPAEKIQTGVDGCGVPVYAVPLRAIALSFLRLANPKSIADDAIAEAAQKNARAIHASPIMIGGTDTPCAIISAEHNMIGKGGALGVYAIGVSEPTLGIACKIMDGAEEHEIMALSLLRRAGLTDTAAYRRLSDKNLGVILNDSGIAVGEKRAL